MEEIMRQVLLSLSKNKNANQLAKQFGLRFGAQRFVAGETIASAIARVQQLNASGLRVTLDHLGEFVMDKAEAEASCDHCVETLYAMDRAQVDANLSIKLTQLGLDIDPELCFANLQRILTAAKEVNRFVRIDMEDHTRCDITLELLQRARERFDNVGTVMQSYLYRAADDVARLAGQGIPLRIVKGAYKEPKEVAFPEKRDVDENYKRLVEQSLRLGNRTAIATHDEALIEWAKRFVEQEGISRELFEFQMLYGIRTSLAHSLVAEGYRMRIYVPFGTDWYGYFMRRLAERPANVGFVLRGLIRS